MENVTLDDLANFSKRENELFKEIFGNDVKIGPSEGAIKHILDYEKVLSVRESRNLPDITMILN